MSKLAQVRKALEENPDITIVAVAENNFLPDRSGNWGHTVEFYVAPKTGGLYTADELQALMMSLIPRLEPTCQDAFRDSGSILSFGKLYFDEVIGRETIHRKITLTDEEMFSSEGFVEGKCLIESKKKVRRRTWVDLFPNTQIADVASKDGKKYWISKNELLPDQRDTSNQRGIRAWFAHHFA